jgi:hypothetical protein
MSCFEELIETVPGGGELVINTIEKADLVIPNGR